MEGVYLLFAFVVVIGIVLFFLMERRWRKILEEIKARSFYAYGCLRFGELYADVREKEKALSILRKGQEMCQEMGMDYWLAETEKALEKLKG